MPHSSNPVVKSIFVGIMLLTCKLTISQHNNRLMQYRAADGVLVAVKTINDWQQKKMQVLQAMQEVMGTLPEKPTSTPATTFTDTLHTAHYTRYAVNLSVAPNELLPTLLYIPARPSPTGKYPAALVLHSTGAEGKYLVDSFSAGPYRAIATELVHRGYIVLAPDYPGFGGLTNHNFANDRYASGTMQGIFNHMRCIDYLQSRTDVYAEKIGAIGHSLGGHNAIFLGAIDERVKVVVSSCGWTLMDHYDAGQAVSERFGGKLGPWAQDRYMPLIKEKYNLDAALLPFDFDELIAAIAPRYFFSCSPLNDENFNGEGVKLGIKRATTIYRLLGVEKNIQADYPDAGHDFPHESKEKAYQLMDRVLR